VEGVEEEGFFLSLFLSFHLYLSLSSTSRSLLFLALSFCLPASKPINALLLTYFCRECRLVVRAVAARKVRAAPEQESEQIEKKEPHRPVPSQVIRDKHPTCIFQRLCEKCFCFFKKARARRSHYVLACRNIISDVSLRHE
jgi:hypothetical protein